MPASINDSVLEVVLPDETPYAGKYELRLGDCTGLDDLDMRNATGFTLWSLINKWGTEDGLGLVLSTAVAWLVRRKTFPHTTYQDVARSVSWGTEFTVKWGELEELAEGEEGNGQGSESDTPKSSEPSPAPTESDPGKSTD